MRELKKLAVEVCVRPARNKADQVRRILAVDPRIEIQFVRFTGILGILTRRSPYMDVLKGGVKGGVNGKKIRAICWEKKL